jgi:Asp-tRNA(Asn)/Glu-tRNA(Gln) amidotransferase A subunit family amidase
MDKIGPIARGVEDCALILGAIHGSDGFDATTVDRPYSWPCRRDLRSLKVGYFTDGRAKTDDKTVQTLRGLGVELVPISLPDKTPAGPLTLILRVEAAAAFDHVTRKKISAGLNNWPDTFRRGQFVPAVEYIRANRLRTQLMRQMEEVFAKVDLYVGGNDLFITNLTGHPTVVLPNGFVKRDDVDVPTSITFTGRLYGETDLLAVAHAFQQATGFHLRRPPMDKVLAPEQSPKPPEPPPKPPEPPPKKQVKT